MNLREIHCEDWRWLELG